MKTEIATTASQSQRLLDCGVSADTADMLWARLDETRDHNLYAIPWYTHRLPNRKITDNDFPAWSLSALLGLLPKRIKRGDCSDYSLSLSCDGCFWDLEYTYARYCGEDDSLVLFEDTDPIAVCVKAIEWLTKNNYKLNEL